LLDLCTEIGLESWPSCASNPVFSFRKAVRRAFSVSAHENSAFPGTKTLTSQRLLVIVRRFGKNARVRVL
jgi:hypothetical protein